MRLESVLIQLALKTHTQTHMFLFIAFQILDFYFNIDLFLKRFHQINKFQNLAPNRASSLRTQRV